MLVSLQNDIGSVPSSFKFFSIWAKHHDCRTLVEEVWNKSLFGCPMAILSQKLKALKKELKVLNRDVFGDINNNVQAAQAEVDQIQCIIDSSSYDDNLHNEESQVQCKLQQALSFQEEFWKQKAKFN